MASTHPAIVDSESNQRNCYARNRTFGNPRVLGLTERRISELEGIQRKGESLQVGRKLGAVVPTVGLGEQSKIVVLIGGELCVECLQKLPDIRCGGDSRGHAVGTVAEAGADRLVNVEHVGVIIPTVRVQYGSRSRDVVEGAWAILLEEANHAAATRTSIEPEGERSGRRAAAGFEEPKPHILRTRQLAPIP